MNYIVKSFSLRGIARDNGDNTQTQEMQVVVGIDGDKWGLEKVDLIEVTIPTSKTLKQGQAFFLQAAADHVANTYI